MRSGEHTWTAALTMSQPCKLTGRDATVHELVLTKVIPLSLDLLAKHAANIQDIQR
jgi:hypothetical protein